MRWACPSVYLFVCLSVCRQTAKTRFSQKLSNLKLWSLLATYRKSYTGFSKPHATLQGAVTWRNQCDDCVTLQGVIIPFAISKMVFRHIFKVFKNAVCALTSGGFRIVSDILVRYKLGHHNVMQKIRFLIFCYHLC